MIVHVHPDGSTGHQFEVGDAVTCTQATAGGWFTRCLQGRVCTVRRIEPGPWRIAGLELAHSPDWGTTRAAPWHCTPTDETLGAARRVPA